MEVGVFANAIGLVAGGRASASQQATVGNRGLAGWLIDRLQRRAMPGRRLSLVERVSLAPRQTLALIEADGQRLLVATSPDGAPVFYPLSAARSSRVKPRASRTGSKGQSA